MAPARQAAAASAVLLTVLGACAVCRLRSDGVGATFLTPPQRGGQRVVLPRSSAIPTSSAATAAPAEAVGIARQQTKVLGSSWRFAAGVGFLCAAVALARCGSPREAVRMCAAWKPPRHPNSDPGARRKKTGHANKGYSIKNDMLEKTIKGGGQDKNLGYRISGSPGNPGSHHAWTEKIRWAIRFKRRIHTRRKIEGTPARPRLAVFRSKEHMHVNVVDDTIGTGVTLCTATSRQKHNLEEIRQMNGGEPGKQKTWSEAAAEVVGRDVAKQCLEKNITMVVFDRGGFPYEGRVQALAEAARSAGLQF